MSESEISDRRLMALILAAGRGSRLGSLTLERPKPLLAVANRSLLAYTHRFVKAVGCDNVRVVGGYQFDVLAQAAYGLDPKIEMVENTQWHQQNAVSALKGLQGLETRDEGVIVTDADFIRPLAAAARWRIALSEVTIFTSRQSLPEKDLMRIRLDEDSRVLDLAKRLPDAQAISAGATFVPASRVMEVCEALQNAIHDLGADTARWEDGLRRLIHEGIPFYGADVGMSDWLEVDTPEELVQAERALRERAGEF